MVSNPRKSLKQYFVRLQESTHALLSYTSGLTEELFADDNHRMHRDAVYMQLQLVGEIIRLIHLHYPGNHGLPKKEAVALRNLIAHTYHKVDTHIIRSVCIHDIPALQKQLQSLIDNRSTNKG